MSLADVGFVVSCVGTAVKVIAAGNRDELNEFVGDGRPVEAQMQLADGTVIDGQHQGERILKRRGEGKQFSLTNFSKALKWDKYKLVACGTGKFISNTVYYQGCFLNNKFHDITGNAEVFVHNREHYTGCFMNGKREGHGALQIYSSEHHRFYKVFEGVWRNDLPSTGTFFTIQGNVYRKLVDGMPSTMAASEGSVTDDDSSEQVAVPVKRSASQDSSVSSIKSSKATSGVPVAAPIDEPSSPERRPSLGKSNSMDLSRSKNVAPSAPQQHQHQQFPYPFQHQDAQSQGAFMPYAQPVQYGGPNPYMGNYPAVPMQPQQQQYQQQPQYQQQQQYQQQPQYQQQQYQQQQSQYQQQQQQYPQQPQQEQQQFQQQQQFHQQPQQQEQQKQPQQFHQQQSPPPPASNMQEQQQSPPPHHGETSSAGGGGAGAGATSPRPPSPLPAPATAPFAQTPPPTTSSQADKVQMPTPSPKITSAFSRDEADSTRSNRADSSTTKFDAEANQPPSASPDRDYKKGGKQGQHLRSDSFSNASVVSALSFDAPSDAATTEVDLSVPPEEACPIIKEKIANPTKELPLTESIDLVTKCIAYGSARAELIADKEGIFLIGNTGAGKSTFVNYLAGCTMISRKPRELGLTGLVPLVLVQPTSEGGALDELMQIGHSKVSATFMPNIESDPSGRTYCDCPGFLDNRGAEINIANAVNIKNTLFKSSGIRVVVLINYHTLLSQRVKGITDMLRICGDLFGSQENLQAHASSLLIGVSHADEDLDLPSLKAHLLADPCPEIMKHLAERIFIFDVLDRERADDWLKREDCLKQIDEMTPINNPSEIFQTVLTDSDEKRLLAICEGMMKQVERALRTKEYDTAARRLTDMYRLSIIGHRSVDRMLSQHSVMIGSYFQKLVDEFKEQCFFGDVEAATAVVADLHAGMRSFGEDILGDIVDLDYIANCHDRAVKSRAERIEREEGHRKEMEAAQGRIEQLAELLEQQRIASEEQLQEQREQYRSLQEEIEARRVAMEENFSGMRDALEQEMQQKLEEKLAEMHAEDPEKQAAVQAEKDALEAFYKEQLQEVEMAKAQYIAQQEREREAREAAMLDREKELIHKITAIESQKAEADKDAKEVGAAISTSAEEGTPVTSNSGVKVSNGSDEQPALSATVKPSLNTTGVTNGFTIDGPIQLRTVREETARKLQEGHGGFVDTMASHLGEVGVFKGLDGDGDVRIKINSGTYAWSPYLVELNVGAEVERGRDWRWGDQDGGMGKRGRVTELGDWVTVKWDDSSSSYRYRWGTDDKFDLKVVYPGGGSQVVPAPAGCVIGGPVHIKVVSKAELERLQTGHGGMTDSMLAMMGKEGTLRAVDSDGDCRVEVEGDRKLWNPAMIEAVGAGGFLPGLMASAIDLSDGDSVATPVRLATSTRASAFVGTVMYPEPEDRVAPYAMAGGSVVQSARQNYFEVEIGRIEPGVGVGVGLASPTKFNCASDDMVGWKDGSFGYHSDDGGIFKEEGYHSKSASTFSQGDRIGVGITRNGSSYHMFLTKNGSVVDAQACTIGTEHGELLPVVSFNGPVGPVKVFTNASDMRYKGDLVRHYTVLPTPSAMSVTLGGSVRIRSVGKEEAERLQKGHGGTNSTMLDEHLGKQGTLERVKDDGDFRIRVNGSVYTWNPALVEMVVGAKVVRGPDWKWGEQDGGSGKHGVVTKVQSDGWVGVQWENGRNNNYRWGAGSSYDLKFVVLPPVANVVTDGTVESAHPYANSTHTYTTIEVPGAEAYRVTFDERTSTERTYDYLQFFKSDDHKEYWGDEKYHGGRGGSSKHFPGVGGTPPLLIPASRFVMHFHTDESNDDWGFKFTATPCPLSEAIATTTTSLKEPVKVGGPIRLKPLTAEQLAKLQTGHGGSNDTMVAMLGKVGKLESLYADGDCNITVDGNLKCFNAVVVELTKGTRVTRGRDWKWDDQDGGKGKAGTIIEIKADGWVRVEWDCGRANSYRWGAEDACDLKLGADAITLMRNTTGNVESVHPYADNTITNTLVEVPGAQAYRITFDEQSSTERTYDYVKFYKDDTLSEYWGEEKYHGGRGSSSKHFPGVGGVPSLVIPASRFVVHFFSDGSNNDWGFKFTATPCALTDTAAAGGGTPQQSQQPLVRIGARVRIKKVTKAEMERIQKGHGGSNDTMADMLGKDGVLQAIDSDGDCRVVVGGVSKLWHPELIEYIVSGSGDSATTIHIGGKVRIKQVSKAELERLQKGHGGFAESMLAMLGKEGTLHSIDKDCDCRVTIDGNRKMWNPVMVEAPGGAVSVMSTVSVGGAVRIRSVSEAKAKELQTGHGGVTATMVNEHLGKEGIFESVDKDGDYRIRINGSANFWNPALVEMVVGAKVVRGTDWKYGDQDGGAGSRGTVTSVQADEWVMVRWEKGGGDSKKYRWGAENSYDLQFVVLPADTMVVTDGHVESVHPYADNTDSYKIVEMPGAQAYRVTFDERSSTERTYDYVKFYKDDTLSECWGEEKYHGGRGSSSKHFPGVGTTPSLIVPAGRFIVHFHSDGSNNDWGFKFTATPCALSGAVVLEKKVGSRVRIKKLSKEALENLQKGHGGSSSEMEAMLGKEGVITAIDSDGDCRVDVRGTSKLWNPAILDVIATGADKLSVTIGGTVQIRAVDKKVAEELQKGHGGSNSSMLEHLGKQGTLESVDGDGDFRIRVNGSANFWNPALVCMAVGATVERGPDWKWDDQDGGAGTRGVVTSVQDDDWVGVCWSNGNAKSNNYRWGAQNAFDLKFVVTASSEVSTSGTVESAHPYSNNTDTYTAVQVPGAEAYRVTFDELTSTERTYDFVKFFKGDDHKEFWGADKYHGGRGSSTKFFPGIGGNPALFIPANRFVVHFHSDGSNNDWGFKFTATPCPLSEATAGALLGAPVGAPITVGGQVRLRAISRAELERLQKGHGGFVESMAGMLGKVGTLESFDSDGDANVVVDGNKKCFNPIVLEMTVGTRVTRGPNWKWADQDGGSGKAGTIKEVKADKWVRVEWDAGVTNSYRWGAEDACDLKIAGGHPISIGGAVRLRAISRADLEKLQKGHGGFVESMAGMLGKVGTLESFDSDGDANVVVDGNKKCFNPIVLEMTVGTRVTRGPDWKWADQDGGSGKAGTIKEVKADKWVRVAWDAGVTNSYRWGAEDACDLKIICGIPITVGCQVRLKSISKDQLEKLQKGHGGFVESMAGMLGKVGTLESFDSDGDANVVVDGNKKCFNPIVLEMTVGTRVTRGPDWKWGDQDGGGAGTVTEVKSTGVCRVEWDAGVTNSYRWGAEDACDLKLGAPPKGAAASTAPTLGQPIALGGEVRLRGITKSDLERLQKGHGGFVESMAGMLGKVGTLESFDSDGDANVVVDGNKKCFNPLVLQLTVGTRVTRGPDWKWADQDGGSGKVGTVTEVKSTGVAGVAWDGGTSNVYRWGAEDARDLTIVSSAVVVQPIIRIGARVRIKKVTKAEMERIQKGHGGSNDTMADMLGKDGVLQAIDSDGDCRVVVGGVGKLWHPELIEYIVSGSGDSATTIKIGGKVKLKKVPKSELERLQKGHGGFADSMLAMLGKDGILRAVDKDCDCTVEVGGERKMWNAQLIESVDLAGRRKVGTKVRIRKVSKAELELLQKGHGGSSDSMLAMMGKEGTIRSIDSDGDCRVEVGSDSKLWNPDMLELI